MIRFKNASFGFDGKEVISLLTETISPGEHVALMGESGAGKSTLISSVMGLISPHSGSVMVDGQELNHHSVFAIRKKIAWVPQEVQLPYTYVEEAMLHPYQLRVNHSKHFDKEKMYQLFDAVGLDRSVFSRRMFELSGGERQRLMLVSAVLLEKDILLLDEPTSALDSATREKVIVFLRKQQVTLLSVTHDASFADSCDRIIVLTKVREQ